MSTFLTSDPQEGVTKHRIEIPAIGLDIEIPAKEDGSLWYDLSNWEWDTGWYDGTVYAMDDYEVIDTLTGLRTTAPFSSAGSPFSLKIPTGATIIIKVMEGP